MSLKRLLLLILLFQSCFVSAKYASKDLVKLVSLVAEPQKYLNKKVFIEGEFNSFSTLALDYKKAMKSSKDYIGILLSRPDQRAIPLVELKIAAPIKMFKDKDFSLEHGDVVAIKAKVYEVALGEPWLEVDTIDIIEKKEEKS